MPSNQLQSCPLLSPATSSPLTWAKNWMIKKNNHWLKPISHKSPRFLWIGVFTTFQDYRIVMNCPISKDFIAQTPSLGPGHWQPRSSSTASDVLWPQSPTGWCLHCLSVPYVPWSRSLMVPLKLVTMVIPHVDSANKNTKSRKRVLARSGINACINCIPCVYSLVGKLFWTS